MILLGLAIATAVAFVVSFGYYAVAPAAAAPVGAAAASTEAMSPSEPTAAADGDRPAPWQILVELLRSAAVAGLLSGLLFAAGWGGPWQGAVLGLALWTLPVVLLAGSVLWEAVPIRSAALHAGDWLIKLVAIGAVVGWFA